MRLNVKAMALACALIWGILAMLLVGLVNLIWPDYGRPFLELAASIYPGYKAKGGIGQVIIGTLYGLLDGLIGGAIFAWLYNLLATPGKPAAAE